MRGGSWFIVSNLHLTLSGSVLQLEIASDEGLMDNRIS